MLRVSGCWQRKLREQIQFLIKMDDNAEFDLRLTISKLQEELSLYRNGTSPEDLLAILEEKDEEIRTLRDNMAAKDSFLSKLGTSAKKSLEDLETLKKEKKRMEAKAVKAFENGKQEAANDLNAARKEIQALRDENESLANSIDLLIPETEHFQEHIDELETDKIHSSSDIENLQQRCVNVVVENKEKKKDLVSRLSKAEEEVKRAHGKIDRYHKELLKAQEFNKSLKERITKEKEGATSYKERVLFLEAQLKAEKENPPLKEAPAADKIKKRRAKTPKKAGGPFHPGSEEDVMQSAFAAGETM